MIIVRSCVVEKFITESTTFIVIFLNNEFQ